MGGVETAQPLSTLAPEMQALPAERPGATFLSISRVGPTIR
jgi:hypothetical protein